MTDTIPVFVNEHRLEVPRARAIDPSRTSSRAQRVITMVAATSSPRAAKTTAPMTTPAVPR